MNPRSLPLAVVLAALSLFFVAPAASAEDALPLPRLVGAGSCAASACHNNHYVKGDNKREHAFWITGDRHAKAYEVLYEKLATDIQKKRQVATPAIEDQRCLSCHVAPDFDVKHLPERASYFKTDGVSCESCHGAASNWISQHHFDTWKKLTPHDKTRYGMNDTQSLIGRAQACVRCHVGEPGMDVDHDLIGAGHPRLNFEYSTYHAGLAKHWPSGKDLVWPRGGPDLEARAWVIGQLVSAHAALELLGERARNEKKSWPDLAQHDCAACHHQLDARIQKTGFGNRKPGVIPWGNYLTMTPVALDSIPLQHSESNKSRAAFKSAILALHKTMDLSVSPDRAMAARQAADAAELLKKILDDLDGKLPEHVQMDKTLRDILTVHGAKTFSSVDEVTQVQLGLAALGRARRDMKLPFPADLRLRQAWQDLSIKLVLPANYERARTFDPIRIKNRITELKDIGR